MTTNTYALYEEINDPASLKPKIRHSPLKRCFDLVFSVTALVTLLPFFLLIAVAVKMNSKGPILFKQQRIGRGGKPFTCYKFRTMHEDAAERLTQLLADDEKSRQEWLLKKKLTEDPRITSLGFFLRKSSLDELPQFWNVLKGELSVVGPRPVPLEEVICHFGNKAPKILSMRPGITGLWQTSGRADISYPERVKLDERYIEEHSLLLDLRLVLKTIPCLFSAKGAY